MSGEYAPRPRSHFPSADVHPGVIETARIAEKSECPCCFEMASLFFGQSDGEHWCIGCQACRDFHLDAECGCTEKGDLEHHKKAQCPICLARLVVIP